MDYRVIISKPALVDLESIARFITQSAHGGPTTALKIGEELIAQSESLARLPYRGATIRRRPSLRKLSHRYYLIFYRVIEATRLVEIIRIWDGRQNPSALILS